MKKILVVFGIGMAIAGMLVAVLRYDRVHVCTVEFEYSRTMEYRNVRSGAERMRLHEVSLRSLKMLFDDWSFGATAGAVPLWKRVREDFLASPTIAERISDKRVDEYLRMTRFDLSDSGKSEIPIKGKLTVNTGNQDVAEELARAYVRCIGRFIDESNAEWALKATMDKGLVVQKLEHELDSNGKKLASQQLNNADRKMLMTLIESNQKALAEARAVWETTIRAYREVWDSAILFQGN